MPTLADVTVRIGADINRLKRDIKNAEREMRRFARDVEGIGRSLTRSITIPVGLAAAAGAKFAADFEEAFLRIETLVGITGDTLDEFRQGIEDISAEVGIGTKELADALFVITSAGQRGAEALDTLRAAAKANQIGLGETAEIARVAVAAVQAYGAANLTATEAVDKLTAIVREGNLAAEELAPALGRVLPIAAALGVSFDEVGANVAAFTRLGISAAESVTALRSLLSKILKPSEQADKALAQMGLTIDDLRASIAEQGLAATLQSLIQAADGNTEALGRLFGNVEGLANALGTAGAQGEEYLRIVQSISNANGIVDEGFQKVAETVNFQLRKALVDLQRSGEQFGAVVLPLVTDLLRQVTPLAKAFGDLDESTKKSIVSVALGAAAVGPLTTGLGALVRGVSTARAAVTSFAGGMRIAADTFASVREAVAATGGRLTRFTGITQAATAAWKAFDSTTKATVIGLVAAGVIALTAALVKMTRQLSGAQAIQRQLNEVNLEAEKAIAAERLEAERLVNVLKDSKRPYNERRKALDRLIDISPKYFSALNLEKSSVEEISKAYDAYVDNLFRVAHARAVQDRIVAIEKKRIELIHRLNELTKQLEKHTNAAVRGFLNFSPLGARTELLRKQIADLEAQQRSLAETFLETAPQIIESTESIADQTPTAPPKPPFKPSTPTDGGQPAARRTLLDVPDLLPPPESIRDSAVKVAAALREGFDRELPKVAAAFSLAANPLTTLGEQLEIIDNKAAVFGDTFNAVAEKLNLVERSILSLLEQGVSPMSTEVQTMVELYDQLKTQMDSVNAEMLKFGESAAQIVESGIEGFFIGLGDAIGGALGSIGEGTFNIVALFEPLLGMLEQLGRLAISTGIAIEAIKKAIESLGGAGAVVAGVALIALAKFVRGQLANLKPREFATGGIVFGPTFALTGEYPGARSNPEVIAPLSELRKYLQPAGGPVEVTGRIEGRDILLASERNQLRRKRTRGF